LLAYERKGAGEPLVLIHGIGHRRQGWYPVLDLLAEHRDVILLDLPGHGESPDYDARGRHAREVIRDELLAFFDELGLVKPHIAGNSLGSLVALELAKDGHVSSATALAPAGFWRNHRDFTYIRGLFATMVAAAGPSRPFAKKLARTTAGRAVMMSWLTAHPTRIEPDACHGDFVGMIRAKDALKQIIRDAYTFDGITPSDLPVTIAWGTRDRVLRPYQARRAMRIMPHATHHVLFGCGHVPMNDDPHTVAAILLAGSSSAPGRTAPALTALGRTTPALTAPRGGTALAGLPGR